MTMNVNHEKKFGTIDLTFQRFTCSMKCSHLLPSVFTGPGTFCLSFMYQSSYILCYINFAQCK